MLPDSVVIVAQRVLKNTGFLIVAQVANRVLYGVLAVYAARALGVEKYGRYAFAISFVGLFTILADAGLEVVLVRDIAQFRERVNQILTNALVLKAALALLAGVLAFAIVEVLGYSQDVIWTVLILSIASGLKSICSTLWALFRGFEQMQVEARLSVLIEGLVTVSGIGMLMIAQDIRLLSAAMLVSYSVGVVLSLHTARSKLNLSWVGVDLHYCRVLLIQALSLGVVVVFVSVYARVDVILLSLVWGDQVVGWYDVSRKINNLLLFIAVAFMNAILPATSARFRLYGKDGIIGIYRKAFKVLMLTALPMSMGLFLLSPKIISWLYGSDYEPSVALIRITGWVLLFMFANMLVFNLLLVIGQQKLLAVAAFVAAVFNTGMNLVVIPRWGYLGAGAVWLATEALLFGIAYWITDVRFRRLGIAGILWRPVIATIVMGGIVYLTLEMPLVVSIIVGAGVYVVTAFFTNAVDVAERRLLLSLLTRGRGGE